jgi:SSS family solute:Na+ symporter
MNVCATVYAVDFHKRLINPAGTDRQLLVITRVTTVVVGSVGMGAALLMIRAESALQTWWQISGVFGGAMLGIFLLGILYRRATRLGSMIGVGAGILVIAWGNFGEGLGLPGFPLHKILIGVAGTAAILVGGIIASEMTRGVRPVDPASRG